MTIRTRFLTWLNGKHVGTDQFGNRYFVAKNGDDRRWVLYNGITEASKVPPDWNAWLHHTAEALPSGNPKTYAWEKDHLPNLTGTVHAYRPRGHASRGGVRAQATGDYEAWNPNES